MKDYSSILYDNHKEVTGNQFLIFILVVSILTFSLGTLIEVNYTVKNQHDRLEKKLIRIEKQLAEVK